MSDLELTTNEDVGRLIRQLGSIWPRRRKRALQQLIARGTDVIEALVAGWRGVERRRKQFFVGFGVTYVGLVTITWLLFNIILSISRHAVSTDAAYERIAMLASILSTVLYGIVVATFAPVWFDARARRQAAGITKLALAIPDARCVNILATRLAVEAMRAWAENLVLNDVRAALASALSDLQAADFNILTRTSRKTLIRWLDRHAVRSVPEEAEVDLSIAILRGLSVTGVVELRPLAEKIASHPANTEWEQRAQEEARLALERLDEWGNQERIGAVLLRGSQSPTTGADQLLRAVGASGQSAAGHLLRAHKPSSAVVRMNTVTETSQSMSNVTASQLAETADVVQRL